jgi:uncharacterized damage-inducible protein DinB
MGPGDCTQWPAYTGSAMRRDDILALFDFNYWATHQMLAAAAPIPVEEFTAPATHTYRNLRGTLVHALDVELSWRRRLRAEPREIWDQSLTVADFPSVATLAERWASDEMEARAWLAELTDADLAAVMDLGDADRFPLWYYLAHIVTHGVQQRRDAALILEGFGQHPPEVDFLYYADSLAE